MRRQRVGIGGVAFALAVGFVACTSRPPVRLDEDDVSTALALVAARSRHFGPEDFRIIGFSVDARERTAQMTLVARKRDRDWARIETADCRRAERDGAWDCLGPHAEESIALADGRAIPVTGIAPALARDALRFLARTERDSLSDVLRITAMSPVTDGAIRVDFDSAPSHGGVSVGSMVLRRTDAGFVVESTTPNSDWFGRPSSEGSGNEQLGRPGDETGPAGR